MRNADYTMLDAHMGRLHLYRFDSNIECVLGVGQTCTGHDIDVLCILITWGGAPAEDALLRAKQFAEWWNENDISGMVEDGTDGELRDALRPFRVAGVCAEITGLRWELG